MPGLRHLPVTLTLLLAAVTPASAQRGEPVVIMVPDGADELLRQVVARMRGELQASGVEVTMSNAAAPSDPRAAVLALAREAGCAAFVVQRPTGPASVLEIWLADSGRTLVRTVAVEPLDPQRAALIAAVQASELLRAAQAERWAPPPPARRPVLRMEPPPPPRPFATTGLHGVAGALMMDAGGLGFAPMLAVGWGTGGGWALRALAAAALLETEERTIAGIARTRPALALLEAQLAFRPGCRLQPAVFAGGGALRLAVSGQGFYPYHDRSAVAWSAAAGAGAGLALHLHPRLAVQLEGRVLVTLPEQVVRVGTEEVAHVGRPLWIVAVSLVGG